MRKVCLLLGFAVGIGVATWSGCRVIAQSPSRFYISDLSTLSDTREAYLLHDRKMGVQVCYLVVESYTREGVALAMAPRMC